MKNDFLTLIGVLLLVVMGTIAPINAQNDKKLNVYVKNFTYNDAILESISENLTSEFETELVKLGIYNVLERNRFDRLQKAMETEKKIIDIQRINTAAIDSLKAYNAKALFFGDMEYYGDDGRCKVTITLQDIYQGNNIKKDHMTIVLGDLKNPKLRGDFVKGLLKKLYAKEVLALKTEQLYFIEGKLSTYGARVKEVLDIYKLKIVYLLELSNEEIKPHLDEIEKKRLTLNEIWEDLNKNRRTYILNFGIHWGDEPSNTLKNLYSETMDDFHPDFKTEMNTMLTTINRHRMKSFKSKDEKNAKMEEIIDDIKVKLDKLLYDYNNDVANPIAKFLDSLSAEIIKEQNN